MGVLETALLSAIAPAAIDIFKNFVGAVGRKIAGVSVDDQIKLQNADLDKLKTLAQLDQPTGAPSQWVVDLRASFRYIGAGVSIAGGLLLMGLDPSLAELGAQLVAAPYSFIFGERLYFGLTGKQK